MKVQENIPTNFILGDFEERCREEEPSRVRTINENFSVARLKT